MREQLNLEGQRAAQQHAHLGKEFEAMLDRAHDLYNRTRRAWVYKIPNAWTFIGAREYDARPTQRRALQQDAGKTRFPRAHQHALRLRRARRGRLRGARPLLLRRQAVRRHGDPAQGVQAAPARQPRRRRAGRQAGRGARGLPRLVEAANRVYWLDALKAREMADRATHAPKGRAKGVTKSLSVAWLEEHAVFLCETGLDYRRRADYLPALTKYWRGE
jgi:hypothetical protein